MTFLVSHDTCNLVFWVKFDTLVPCPNARRAAAFVKGCAMDERDELVEGGLMTVKEAAVFLGLSAAKLYALMESGDLVYCKIGRSRRIPRRALVKLAARNLIDRREG
jgi:excisionase family DNA binding protein